MLRNRFLGWVALALVALSAMACDLRGFRVMLRSFEADQVQGLWLWRADPAGDYQRFVEIEFGALQQQGESEYLPYSFEFNGAPVTLQSPVDRTEGMPVNLTVTLMFGHVAGSFKVSSYNASGESPLSDGTLIY